MDNDCNIVQKAHAEVEGVPFAVDIAPEISTNRNDNIFSIFKIASHDEVMVLFYLNH